MSHTEDLEIRIARLIERDLPGASKASVASLGTMFGGNARKAYGFDVTYALGGEVYHASCVMLSQVDGRQVESDVAREYHVLRGLNAKGARVPIAIAVDATGSIVGSPSIVLERLPGKTNALDFLKSEDPAAARALTQDLAEVVAQLHGVDWDTASFDPALSGLSGRELVALQIDQWAQAFETHRMEPNPVLTYLFGWLRRELPDPERVCVVHGDLRPGNFLYERARVTGLLDWEMAHLGDPIEDLAWIYRPFWSPQGFMPLTEFVAVYRDLTGRKVSWADVLYYRIFSEVKFATISLTAAKAFAARVSQNLRHADRAANIGPCLRRSLDWIELHRAEMAHA